MTFIIAEIGVNHDGSLERAKYLIQVSAKAGADAVKFQTFNPDNLAPRGPMLDFFRWVRLSNEDHFMLKHEAEECGVEFMSTPFDVESIQFLAGDLGVKRIKLASGALFQPWLMRAATMWQRQIILSTGMGDMDQIGAAVDILGAVPLSLLHCVSSYPTPTNEMNLSAVKTLKKFGRPVGLSDHSLSLVAPAVAVSMGAAIIEKHITTDRTLHGPDHKASLEPDEFRKMVEFARETEKSVGDGAKIMRACEIETWKIIRDRENLRPSLS